MSNIRSLGDFSNNRDDSKKVTSSFTGGEKSGLAVENPDNSGWPIGEKVESPPAGSRRVVIYKNGFRVDDGPFRSDSLPENKKFIKELQAGFAPRELEGLDGQPIHVALEDKRHETYVEKRSNYNLFSGSGMSLSSASTSEPIQPIDFNKANEVVIDHSKPVTTLQIRFHDGKKIIQKFNEDATVADLHNYFMRVAPVNGEYRILQGFPPKEITEDVNTTLKDAGLLHSVLSQKLL